MDVNAGFLKANKISEFKFHDILLLLYISSVLIISALPMGNLISKILGLLLIVYFIIFRMIWNNQKIIINNQILFCIIWFFFCVISGYVATDFSLFANKLFTIFQLIIFLIIGYSLLKNDSLDIKYIIIVIFVSSIFLFVVGIRGQNPSPFFTGGRMASTTGNANTLASYGAFSVLLSIYLFFIFKNKLIKIILFALQIFICYGILETRSRKGIIVVILGLIIFVLLNNIHKIFSKRIKIKSILSFVTILVVLITVVIFGFDKFKKSDYYQRFQRLTNYMQSRRRSSDLTRIIDYSAYERQRFVKYGLKMWSDNPVLGVGLDNFRANINNYWISSRKAYAHNNYVELLADIGIFGFIAFYLIYLSILGKLFSLRKRYRFDLKSFKLINLFLTIMICRLIQELALVTYYEKFNWILLLIILVFAERMTKKDVIKTNI